MEIAASALQSLLLLTWLSLSGMVFLLALIGRYFSKMSGQPTYYLMFVLPFIFFSLGNARYITLDRWGGDLWGDGLMFLTGISLMLLSIRLYVVMTAKR